MTNIILELGGDPRRNETAARLAKEDPTALVVVSSDGPVGVAASYYSGMESRVFWDFHAWDTVSNFTETYRWIKAKNPKKLFVVTSSYHMKRAMAIAGPVWFGRGVDIVPVEHPSPFQKDPQPLPYMLQALLWRLGFGYAGGPRKERMAGILAERDRAIALGLQVIPD
jgi:uncharacterized SAM-binding protein YcdF (DUF218 family)